MRVRTDNCFGTLTNDPLASGGTTVSSAGLANLDVVSGGDEALITLDPNREHGAPEIIRVTAHTSMSTDATATRGQFGTAAREHPLGTEWVHGPIGGDSTTLVDDADDQGDFIPMGEWEDWSPSYTNLTVGSGTVSASFMRAGRTVHWRWQLVWAADTSVDGASPRFTLPVPPASQYAADTSQGANMGEARYADDGTADYRGFVHLHSGSSVAMLVTRADATFVTHSGINSTVPATWTTNDRFEAHGTYEAAA